MNQEPTRYTINPNNEFQTGYIYPTIEVKRAIYLTMFSAVSIISGIKLPEPIEEWLKDNKKPLPGTNGLFFEKYRGFLRLLQAERNANANAGSLEAWKASKFYLTLIENRFSNYQLKYNGSTEKFEQHALDADVPQLLNLDNLINKLCVKNGSNQLCLKRVANGEPESQKIEQAINTYVDYVDKNYGTQADSAKTPSSTNNGINK